MPVQPIGIYKITNTLNNKVYIGQSKNVYERRTEHFVALRRNRHPNKEMQRDWNKDNRGFRFDIIELTSLNKLNEREKYWIDFYNSTKTGYNQGWVPYKRKEKKKRRKIIGYRRRS